MQQALKPFHRPARARVISAELLEELLEPGTRRNATHTTLDAGLRREPPTTLAHRLRAAPNHPRSCHQHHTTWSAFPYQTPFVLEATLPVNPCTGASHYTPRRAQKYKQIPIKTHDFTFFSHFLSKLSLISGFPLVLSAKTSTLNRARLVPIPSAFLAPGNSPPWPPPPTQAPTHRDLPCLNPPHHDKTPPNTPTPTTQLHTHTNSTCPTPRPSARSPSPSIANVFTHRPRATPTASPGTTATPTTSS